MSSRLQKLAAVYRTLQAAGGDPTRADPALRRAAIYSALVTDRNPTNPQTVNQRAPTTGSSAGTPSRR